MNTRSALYGAGVFTTIRIINGEPRLWEKHRRRLLHDAERLGMDLSSLSAEEMLDRVKIRVAGEEISNGRLRITLSDNRSSPLWPSTGRGSSTNLTVQTGVLNEVERPFRLGMSQRRINSTSPIAGLKTCNYLEPLVSLDEARDKGFAEAIRLNDMGHVTSACMANIFWRKGDELFTPSLETGCLAGTTREFVMENFDVREVEADMSELASADAIFLTSAGLGIIAAEEFNGRVFTPADHRLLTLMPGAK